MFEMLSQASIVAKLSLAVGVLPLGFGVAYAARPSEQRLAVMRPISLAAIFAGLTGSLTGAINVLSVMWRTQPRSKHTFSRSARPKRSWRSWFRSDPSRSRGCVSRWV